MYDLYNRTVCIICKPKSHTTEELTSNKKLETKIARIELKLSNQSLLSLTLFSNPVSSTFEQFPLYQVFPAKQLQLNGVWDCLFPLLLHYIFRDIRLYLWLLKPHLFLKDCI